MSFKTPRLPASIQPKDLAGVLSLRGEKLTYLDSDHVYVVRSGDDPRAWRKPVDSGGNGTGPWQHCRPDCNIFLRDSESFQKARQELISQWFRVRNTEMTMREQAGSATGEPIPIWKRGRRADPELRTLQAWIESKNDIQSHEEIPLSRRLRTNSIRRRDFRQAKESDLVHCYGDPRYFVPTLSNQQLIDQHYILRRLLRLNRVSRWADQFPRDAIQFVERHNFSTRRWHLLNLWIRVPEGRELFDDLPQLAWLLASSWNFKSKPVQKPLRSLRALVKKPRSALLAWLDLPGGKGTIKVLRRIPPSDFSPKVAYWLREALKNGQSRSWLQNLEGRIDGRILYLLGRQQPITFPIAVSIAKDEKAGPPSALLAVSLLYFHIRKMLRDLGREEEIPNLGRVHSAQRLRQWHDQLITEINMLPDQLTKPLSDAWDLAGNRVDPPFEPAQGIHPLTTHREIAEEGRAMHHCLATLSHDVARGSFYAYAIFYEGERATVGLQCGIDDTWRLAELRGQRNTEVSLALKKYIGNWIKQASAIRKSQAVSPIMARRKSADEWVDESEYAGARRDFLLTEDLPF